MIDFEGSTIVDRPIEDVFAFVSNPANIPSYQNKVVSTRIVSQGPVGKGTRFLETVQIGPGKMDVTCEIAAYEAPRRVAFIARNAVVHCDAEYVSSLRPGARAYESWASPGCKAGAVYSSRSCAERSVAGFPKSWS